MLIFKRYTTYSVHRVERFMTVRRRQCLLKIKENTQDKNNIQNYFFTKNSILSIALFVFYQALYHITSFSE